MRQGGVECGPLLTAPTGAPPRQPAPLLMITCMGGDARRTLLVVSERPHPWVLLRDWLDPELVNVAWLRPRQPVAGLVPWLVAGEGAAAPAGVRGLVAWHWVGPAPGLPIRPVEHEDWRAPPPPAHRPPTVPAAGGP